MRIRTFFLAAVMSFCTFGHCQDPTMEPAPELKKLGWYIGEWSGKDSA